MSLFQICGNEKDKSKLTGTEKRKADDGEPNKDLKKVSVPQIIKFLTIVSLHIFRTNI